MPSTMGVCFRDKALWPSPVDPPIPKMTLLRVTLFRSAHPRARVAELYPPGSDAATGPPSRKATYLPGVAVGPNTTRR